MLIAVLALSGLLTSGAASAPTPDDIRVYMQDDHALGKYEPEQGAYLGAFVLSDPNVDRSMAMFESKVGKKHAAYIYYLHYKQRPIADTQWWLDSVAAQNAGATVALEPWLGLDTVNNDAELQDLADRLAAFDRPVFLRFASEMNGNWAPWSGEPALFKAKWRLVHDIMAAKAPNVMMVWTVAATPTSTARAYYPGDEYVDWVGVNVYSMPYHNDDITALAGTEDPIQLTDFVYRLWADRKPIQVSEYGAAHDTVLDDASYVNFAINRMSRMYRGLLAYYPRVKAIFYFDLNAIQNGQTGRQYNNYDLTSDSTITNAYRTLIGQSNYLSNIGANIEGAVSDDLFEVKNQPYAYDGRLYIRLSDFLTYSSGSVISRTATTVNVTANGQSFALSPSTSEVIKINDIEYVAVETAAARAGYAVTKNNTYNTMTLTR